MRDNVAGLNTRTKRGRILQRRAYLDLILCILDDLDTDTDEVVRQIPSEELVRLARAIKAINELRTAGAGGVNGTGLLLEEQA